MAYTKRKKQSVEDVIISVPMVKSDGSNVLPTLGSLSTRITSAAGANLTGYTEAVFSIVNGEVIVRFTAGSQYLALDTVTSNAPYKLIVQSTDEDVQPSSLEVYIIDDLETTMLADMKFLIDDLHDEAFGRWVMDPVSNSLKLYRVDGSLMKQFNLTSTSVNCPTYVERNPI
jgi:hypothetical protein